MSIEREEWQSIYEAIAREAPVREIIEGAVIDRDEETQTIFVREIGPTPIPLVGMDYKVHTYKNGKRSTVIVEPMLPEIGDIALVARLGGNRGAPRCVGILRSGRSWKQPTHFEIPEQEIPEIPEIPEQIDEVQRYWAIGNVGTGAATVETDLQSVIIPGGTLQVGDLIRIMAAFVFSGTASSRTARLRFGTAIAYVITFPTTVAGHVLMMQSVVAVHTTVNQQMISSAVQSGTSPVNAGTVVNPVMDISNDIEIKTTGQTPNAADEVTGEMLTVEVLRG